VDIVAKVVAESFAKIAWKRKPLAMHLEANRAPVAMAYLRSFTVRNFYP
jgi:hypothetical protein